MTGDDFTQLLREAQSGRPDAEQCFFQLVNDELRETARRLVRRYPGNAQPTSLVNELFLKLFRADAARDLKNRRYFFAVAIDQMRQILRERHRQRTNQRSGGRMQRLSLDIVLDQYVDDFEARNKVDFFALDEALEDLKTGSATARQYEAVRLHYLLGFQQTEIAELFDLDAATVSRDLKAARAKLALALRGDPDEPG